MPIVVFNFGRMNPPTVGHEKLINVVQAAAKKLGAEARVYLSHTQDHKKNPLDHATKVKFAKAAFGNIIVDSPAKTIIEVMQELEKAGFTDAVIVAGDDRVADFDKLLNTYNGKEYNFRAIKTLSAGHRDPDSDGVEGMSASKMRELAQNDDLEGFTAGLPTKIQKAAATVMKAVKLGLEKPAKKKATKESTKVQISTNPKELGAWVDDSEQDEEVVDLPIKSIIAVLEPDEEHQTKKGAPERIAKMVAALQKGKDTPPILVRKYKGGYQVLDGHHRFKAYREAGREDIPAMVVADRDITDVSDKVERGEEIKEAGKFRKSPWDKMASALRKKGVDLDKSDERAQAALAGLKQNAADYQAILDREKKAKENVTEKKEKPRPTNIHLPDGTLWTSDHFFERAAKYNIDRKNLANTLYDLVKNHSAELVELEPVDFVVRSKAGYSIAISKFLDIDDRHRYVLLTIHPDLRVSAGEHIIMTEDDLNVHFHDTLNTKLFSHEGQMYPIVRKKLLDIADDFKEFLGIELPGIKDITVSGSNAAYTYTPKSDIDLHLVVDLPQADNDHTFRELFDAKKYQYNAQHDYTIREYDVELYVQNANEAHVSQGIYSILHDEWVQEPKPVNGHYDRETTHAKYDQIKHLILLAAETQDYGLASKLRQTIKKYRQVGLHTTGEFGPENLAFKALRANGYIQKLYDLLNDLKDREFSLEHLEEEQINELEMNPSSFAAFAKTPTGAQTMVGFEAEMIVPDMSESNGYSDYESEPNYGMDDYVETSSLRALTDDLHNFFRDTTGRRTVERAVEEANEKIFEYMEEQFQKDVSDEDIKAEYKIQTDLNDEEIDASMDEQDHYYTDILDSLREEYFSNWDDLDGALKSLGLRKYSDWGSEYDFDWPYYDEPENEFGISDDTMKEVADEIKEAVGMPVKYAAEYHAFKGNRAPGVWYLETDSSINADESDGEGGLELVSPPMPVDQALEKLDAVFAWMNGRNAYTDSSTGFHMGVSIPNMESLDHLKLVLFLGDQYILKEFKRATNSYTKSSLEKMQVGNVPHTVKQMPGLFSSLRQGLDATALKMLSTMLVPRGDRYVSVNIKDSYIEFRSAGGNYLEQLDKIKNTMLRYVRVMGIASNPAEGKQEYAKKLYKLLIEGVDNNEDANTLKWFAMYASGNIPKEELVLRLKRAQFARQAKKNPTPAAPQQAQQEPGPWARWNVYDHDDQVLTSVSARNQQEASQLALRWGRENNRVVSHVRPDTNESKRPTSLAGYISESARPFEWKKEEPKQRFTDMQLACIIGGHEYTGELE